MGATRTRRSPRCRRNAAALARAQHVARGGGDRPLGRLLAGEQGSCCRPVPRVARWERADRHRRCRHVGHERGIPGDRRRSARDVAGCHRDHHRGHGFGTALTGQRWEHGDLLGGTRRSPRSRGCPSSVAGCGVGRVGDLGRRPRDRRRRRPSARNSGSWTAGRQIGPGQRSGIAGPDRRARDLGPHEPRAVHCGVSGPCTRGSGIGRNPRPRVRGDPGCRASPESGACRRSAVRRRGAGDRLGPLRGAGSRLGWPAHQRDLPGLRHSSRRAGAAHRRFVRRGAGAGRSVWGEGHRGGRRRRWRGSDRQRRGGRYGHSAA